VAVQPDQVLAYQQPFELVAAALRTDAGQGLSDDEARRRLQEYGRNELASEPPVAAWRKFLGQFQDALVILLLVATAISTGLWFYERDAALPYDAIAIGAVVLLNAVMGYIQESRAESAVAALNEIAAAQAHVIRDGQLRNVDATEIVPGDIIQLEEGDTIPADARVIVSTALQTAEAALTGESLPVTKDVAAISGEIALGDRDNMVFSGTTATYGRGRGIVVATGMQTEMGRIAGLLRDVHEDPTPLQKELDRVGKLLGAVVVAIAVVMIVTILLVENISGLSALFDVLILGVALAVAAVPEGLPAVVTAVLSVGVQRMARRNAIVRRLRAVETLGSADVIASDKTGTLTKNEMTVRAVVTAGGRVTLEGTGYAPDGAARLEEGGAVGGALLAELNCALGVADRANNAVLEDRNGRWTILGDPTEGALLVAARKIGLDAAALDVRFRRVGEVPFSSERKLMSTIHTDAEQAEVLRLFTKGAPDVLLTRCSHEHVGEGSHPLSSARRLEILKTNEELAGRALRTLGIAYRDLPVDILTRADPSSVGNPAHEPRRDVAGALAQAGITERVERDLVFAGLVGMIDPPRDEARNAVARAKAAGIRPIMITGDHPITAAVIAKELGIGAGAPAVTGAEIERAEDDSLAETVRDVSVYARVNPEHKLRIVRALQRHGGIVAMTGDGVNDAPALKTADIGIAMGITGTDVSKAAADMVLADDNFASIVAAVEEGRAIFANIRKFLRYLLSSNIGEVMTMFFGVLLAPVIGLPRGGGAVVLPLLATQLLWINLVTDGAPALALGIDPADPGLMTEPPRSKNQGVITGQMWFGIFFVGAVMALGTLFILDASLPGGLISGSGDLRYAQTMAFTTLMLAQLFNVFNARSDVSSAFARLFTNRWLWGAVGLSLALHVLVIYTPFLQQAFSTTGLSGRDWLLCVAVASAVLWVRELNKAVVQAIRTHRSPAGERSA
jgi:P-type Ca2+ transporter type 2C